MKVAKATKSSRTSTKRTRSSRSFVPNSSDNENDIIETESLELQNQPTRRVLKEVSIVVMGKKKASSALQVDQDSSLGSPSLDNSDYETPGTSISTTPLASFGRGARSTRKSRLSATMAASSSRKRGHVAIADTDEETEDMDLDMSLDAKLARQLQKEEYTNGGNKRQKLGYEDLISSDSDDELSEEPTEMPAYVGKGKGKAKAVDPPRGRKRSARSSAKQKILLDDDDLQESIAGGDSDEDEFKLDEDLDIDPDDLDEQLADLVSDSDDEPLMNARKRDGKNKGSLATPAKKEKKRKNLTYKEKLAKKNEAAARNARFAHIADKWERKRAMNRERAEGNHPKLLTMWDDLAAIPVLEVQKAEQPNSINRRLKPFQLEGLSWMIRQEKTDYKGGLLGDEMGECHVFGRYIWR